MDSDMGIDFGRGRGRAEWRWGKVEKMGTVRAYIIKINRLKNTVIHCWNLRCGHRYLKLLQGQ